MWWEVEFKTFGKTSVSQELTENPTHNCMTLTYHSLQTRKINSPSSPYKEEKYQNHKILPHPSPPKTPKETKKIYPKNKVITLLEDYLEIFTLPSSVWFNYRIKPCSPLLPTQISSNCRMRTNENARILVTLSLTHKKNPEQ